jgi:hypothetical protein
MLKAAICLARVRGCDFMGLGFYASLTLFANPVKKYWPFQFFFLIIKWGM